MVPLKRRKLAPSTSPAAGDAEAGSSGEGGSKFPQVILFLLERKMGSSRRAFLSGLGRTKGFLVTETFSERVTHVVSENNSGEEVGAWLSSQDGGHRPTPPHLLDISWFTESVRAGRPVEVLERHQLVQEQPARDPEVLMFSVASYACQRRTPLDHQNAVLADALSLLAEKAELNEEEGRSVAFCRAAAVLKALPQPVTDITQLRGLPCLGDHTLRVIKEVLENGASGEVESTRRSERYKVLKVLTGIFGVGAKTAERWFRDGIRSLQQLQDSGCSLNRAQQAGLVHYNDLNQAVTRAEADAIAEVVEEAVLAVLPGAQITLTGGFRRGKLTGHDVDFLITHPEEGREEGLLSKVVAWLESQGFLLYQKTTRNSYLESNDGPARPASNMDRFERCFSIFKLEQRAETENGVQPCENVRPAGETGSIHTQVKEEEEEEQTQAARHGAWRAVRVDLVVSPFSQFAFALLGWTGSKLFERELRRWAGHEKAMSLSSHALYDNKQGRYLRATTEEEIFAHLDLEFIPPSERNA
ncbi:DNA-directed DNA/RNA polymerase mu [Aulostomus maculatus]